MTKRRRASRERKVRPIVRAAIDCGANSVHVLVAVAAADAATPLLDESIFLGLGKAARHGSLGTAKIGELVATVERYAGAARRLGAEQVLVVGTDPFRRARDAASAVEELHRSTDLELAILGVDEEAMLTLLGVTQGRRLDRSLSVCDIGGGSTEIAILEPGTAPKAVAIHAGSASLPERLNPHDPPTPEDIANLRAAAAVAVRRAHLPRTDRFVAVGGNSRNLLRLLPTAAADRSLTSSRLDAILRVLAADPAAVIAERHGINPRRTPLLPTGAAILEAILAQSGTSHVEVIDASAREGLLFAFGEAGQAWRARLSELASGWRPAAEANSAGAWR
jgi:exopolyphosphatase/guanosine-5'-triphosphate,3'-diphosphate pyrophosphatase